ncbi:MAG TPA: ribonuclease HII [Clostridiaceae bacterium]|nr:ribonuclease HII [Clostridiaceae bacterium]
MLSIKELEMLLAEKDTDEALEYLYSIKDDNRRAVIKLIEKYEKLKNEMKTELARFNNMLIYEEKAYLNGFKLVAGVDEAGRGPLAGPVVAASVILPRTIFIKGLDDSKKLTPKKREELFDEINNKAIAVSVGIIDVDVIDRVNILNATKMAMDLAVRKLLPEPDYLLIDAVKLDKYKTRQEAIIKGDQKSASIAAASVIAKVTRDRILDRLHEKYPQYGFIHHKGYGTKEHIDAIKKYGICPIHRLSFTKNIVS